jgi:hypothetical protein
MIHIAEFYDCDIAERRREIDACERWGRLKILASDAVPRTQPRLRDRLLQRLGDWIVSFGLKLQSRSETIPSLNVTHRTI